MDMLVLTINAVIPLLLLIFFGYFLTRIGFFTQDFLRIANALCFKFLVPVSVFLSMYNSGGIATEEVSAMVFCMVLTLVTLPVAFFLVPKLVRDDRERGVMIQSTFRGNFVIYGTAVCLRVFGDESAALVALLTGFMIPVYNFSAALVLSYFADRVKQGRSSPLKALVTALTNPLFVAPILGMVLGLLAVPIPTPLMNGLSDIAQTANPMAQIFMGGCFTFAFIRKYRWKLIAISFVKLLLVPGIAAALAILLGFTGYQLGVIVCLFGAPAAVTTFNMTCQIGGDADLAVSNIVVTTCLSCVSLCVLFTLFRHLGLL